MVRYGVIGCGNISKFHFHALKKLGAAVTYAADINEEAARERSAGTGAKITADYNELIGSPDVDVVVILANGSIHKDAAMKAIARGKGVICEKTMMNNSADAAEVARAAQKAGVLFFTSYMKRFFPAAKKAKELMEKLGHVFSATVRSYQAWGNFYTPEHGWDLDGVLRVYGGAIVKCAASHMLDMTLYLLGRPKSVYASVDFYPDTKFDRKATALFEYEDGMVASFETAAHPLKKIGYERNSWDEFIEINGTGGRMKLSTVMWDHPENNAALLTFYDNETETETEYRFDAMNPFDAEIAYFNHCFETGEKGAPNEKDGFAVDALIETIFLSAEQKKSIPVDWRGIDV